MLRPWPPLVLGRGAFKAWSVEARMAPSRPFIIAKLIPHTAISYTSTIHQNDVGNYLGLSIYIYRSISIYLSIYPSIHPSIYLSQTYFEIIWLIIFRPLSLSIYIYVYNYIYRHTHTYVHTCIYVRYICIHVHIAKDGSWQLQPQAAPAPLRLPN